MDHFSDQKKIIHELLEKAYELRGYDLSKSIQLAEKALRLSRAHQLDALTAKGLSRLALYRMIRGEHEESLEMSNEAIDIFTDLEDEHGIALAKYSIAGLHYKTNNYHLGMAFLLESLISFKKFNDYPNQSRTFKSLGTIYEFLGDAINAKISYEEAISVAKIIQDKNLESNAYNPLSGLLLNLNKIDESKKLIDRSIELKTETNDLRGLAFAIYGRGKVYLKKGAYDKALVDFESALKIHVKFGEKFGESMAKYKLAKLYLKLKKVETAKQLLKENILFTSMSNSLMIYLKCNKLLSNVYKEEGNIERALFYLDKYITAKEKNENLQTVKIVENYERAAILKSSARETLLELEKTEILAKKETAEQAAIVRQEFLSVMSHEIRTPLNAVTSIISLLENKTNPEEQELLTSLRFSSKNLLRIIDDILDFSKLDSNKMLLEKYPANLESFLQNIRLTYLNMAKEKGLDFIVDFDCDVTINYNFDETKLFQILGNLLSNAIKYTERGGIYFTITILKETLNEHTFRFEVKDTGIGIPKAEIAKLFDSFYIPASITTRDLGGTGLGLAIVKKLINLHESEVHIKSEPNKGSTFQFDLTFEISKQAPPSIEDIYQSLENKRTILAEDNEVNALVMTKLLNRSGVEVIRAKDGERAVELSVKHEVDFI